MLCRTLIAGLLLLVVAAPSSAQKKKKDAPPPRKGGDHGMVLATAMDVALGKYGKTPGPIDPAVLELALKKPGTKLVEHRPADDLAPRMPALRAELAAAGLPTDDEACVLHAMFPREFAALHKAPPAAAAPAAPAVAGTKGTGARYAVTINGQRTEVSVADLG